MSDLKALLRSTGSDLNAKAADDIERLERELADERAHSERLAEALREQEMGPGCWCEMAIGNPNVRSHAKCCERNTALLAEHERRKGVGVGGG